jgi:hypothetical protein
MDFVGLRISKFDKSSPIEEHKDFETANMRSNQLAAHVRIIRKYTHKKSSQIGGKISKLLQNLPTRSQARQGGRYQDYYKTYTQEVKPDRGEDIKIITKLTH